MFLRVLALVALLFAATPVRAQVAIGNDLPQRRDANGNLLVTTAESAWLDLRQTPAANSTPQNAPSWVDSVTLVPIAAKPGTAERTIFRIRVSRPALDLQMLLLRLFFDDKPEQRPTIVAWDESGTQVLQSGQLGVGIDLPSSDSVLVPMMGVTCVDIEVPGDGKTVRGVYLDWMTSRQVAHPLSATPRDVVPEPFAAAAPLHAPEMDKEAFGTVTATLAADTIRIGASISQGASFQFGLETQPLTALLTFEVSGARADAPPEVYVNGESLGPVALTLPDLADPGYRGETQRLVDGMRFRYTGWVRAQKLVPAANLRVGGNDVIVIGGPGTPVSAIRATQIQLKYLWDKSDYLLDPR
ncbi:MAG TPA: hypothetical protein VF551_09945 [Chthoniobacterales bacterium]